MAVLFSVMMSLPYIRFYTQPALYFYKYIFRKVYHEEIRPTAVMKKYIVQYIQHIYIYTPLNSLHLLCILYTTHYTAVLSVYLPLGFIIQRQLHQIVLQCIRVVIHS